MPRSITSKRARRDVGTADALTNFAIPETPDAAVAFIRRLMKEFSVDPAMLEDDDSGVSLSSRNRVG